MFKHMLCSPHKLRHLCNAHQVKAFGKKDDVCILEIICVSTEHVNLTFMRNPDHVVYRKPYDIYHDKQHKTRFYWNFFYWKNYKIFNDGE